MATGILEVDNFSISQYPFCPDASKQAVVQPTYYMDMLFEEFKLCVQGDYLGSRRQTF